MLGFTLSDPACTAPGCAFSGGATAGECTQNVGTLSLPEINRILAKGATVKLDKPAAVKYAVFNTNQWVSYDDAETLKLKIDYANSHCLGGYVLPLICRDILIRAQNDGMGGKLRQQ